MNKAKELIYFIESNPTKLSHGIVNPRINAYYHVNTIDEFLDKLKEAMPEIVSEARGFFISPSQLKIPIYIVTDNAIRGIGYRGGELVVLHDIAIFSTEFK